MDSKPGMVSIAAECVKRPLRRSIWVPSLDRFVCPDSDAGGEAMTEVDSPIARDASPLHPQFKLVFLSAAGGTLLFVILCVVMTLISGREPPPLWERVAMSFFDLAKIGFGAVVGMLGGQRLQASGTGG